MTKYSSRVVVDTRRLYAARGFSGDGLTLETPPGDFGFAVASAARLAGVVRWPVVAGVFRRWAERIGAGRTDGLTLKAPPGHLDFAIAGGA